MPIPLAGASRYPIMAARHFAGARMEELFYFAIDKSLWRYRSTRRMTSRGGRRSPRVLFRDANGRVADCRFQYAVFRDGNRFLMNSMPDVGAAPLTVLMK